MSRKSVTALVLLAAVLVSGRAVEQVSAPSVAQVTEPAAVEAFGARDIARFLHRVNPALSRTAVERIAAAVMRYGDKYEIDPQLVTQVMWVESGARPWVRSPLGAVGLMQVMPRTAEPLGLAGRLASIEGNIEAGCWILADNIRRLGEEDGISAYFWGSKIRSVSYLHRVREAREAVEGPSES